MIHTNLMPNEIDLLAKRQIASGMNLYKPVAPLLFNKETPDRLNEKISVMGGDTSINQVADGGAATIRTFREIGSKTFTSVEYREAYAVTHLMKLFNSMGTVMKEFQKSGYYGLYKQDELCASVLTGGFDTTTTWDGAYLFSASHYIKDNSETQNNLATGVFTKDNLFAAYNKLKQGKDHRGKIQPITGAYLVIPTILGMNAWEKVKSNLSPENANNNTNYFGAGGASLKVVEWPLLDLASTTAWYLLSEKMFHELTYMVKEDINFRSYIDNPTKSLVEEIGFVQTQGATDYIGAVGSTGA